jgi:hypothetical protein
MVKGRQADYALGVESPDSSGKERIVSQPAESLLDKALADLTEQAVNEQEMRAHTTPTPSLPDLPAVVAGEYAERLKRAISELTNSLQRRLTQEMEGIEEEVAPRFYWTDGRGPYCHECFFDGRSGPGESKMSRLQLGSRLVCVACAKSFERQKP